MRGIIYNSILKALLLRFAVICLNWYNWFIFLFFFFLFFEQVLVDSTCNVNIMKTFANVWFQQDGPRPHYVDLETF